MSKISRGPGMGRNGVANSVSGLWRALKELFSAWTWHMAWRDSRRSRRRLLLYSFAIVLGVAALIAIGSFRENLSESIEAQAKTLLGADLALLSNTSFSDEENQFFNSLGGVQARELSFSSMVYFPRTGSTRLAQVRALEGAFPFYGTLETDPKNAASTFREGSGALVEESMMRQFKLQPGDEVTVGGKRFHVAGALQKVPGEMAAFSSFAPRVYVTRSSLPTRELLGKGSLVRYKVYFKFGPEVRVPALVKRIRPTLDRLHLEVDTVEHRKRELGRAMTNLYHFLNLVAFVALLLGGVGIASTIHVYVKEKLATVAILRSLGCTAAQAFAVYLAQTLGLAMAGVIVGAVLGCATQLLLPKVLADFVPIQFSGQLSPGAVAQGAAIGFVTCLLFALLPLLAVRRIPPLAVLRSTVTNDDVPRARDPARQICLGLIVAGLLWFSLQQAQTWRVGLGFTGGLAVAFLVLFGLAKGLAALIKRSVAQVGPFTWRQGLASLYRPNNRTVLIMLSLGLGTFLIVTLHLVQSNLIAQILPGGHDNRADTVLFDIQPDQRDGIVQLLASRGLPLLQDVPVVTMRLAEIKGQSVETLRKDPGRTTPNWALRREYRSTYRSELVDSEKLLAGHLVDRVPADASPVPVSLEEGIARTLHVDLGDEIVFDVQGVPVKTVVTSLREVDWRRLQPNFFVVFPHGVLEDAPSFHVVVTRAGSSERTADLQRDLVRSFPNVSVLDLTLVLRTIDSILSKISFVIRFMALFTVGTGGIVLLATLWSGRAQRLQESILLRTLGSSRAQIRQILAVEYLSLGSMAALTGILLAIAASWALAHFVFKVAYQLSPWPLLLALVCASAGTLAVGLLTSRGICNTPPLEVLRRES